MVCFVHGRYLQQWPAPFLSSSCSRSNEDSDECRSKAALTAESSPTAHTGSNLTSDDSEQKVPSA